MSAACAPMSPAALTTYQPYSSQNVVWRKMTSAILR